MNASNYQPKYPVLTIEKALEILNYFKNHPNPNGVSITDLCHILGMKKSNVHRILDTLYAHHYVEKTVNGRYRLGWELYHLGNTVPLQHTLTTIDYTHFLETLCHKYSESISVGKLDNDEILTIYSIEPNTKLRASSQIGLKDPLYATGKGKLFLSERTDKQIYDYYREHKVIAFTNKTIITANKMVNELMSVRKNGYAMDCEEQCDGLICFSMPVRDFTGTIVAAISVSGPSQRILPKIENGIKEDLKQTTLMISQRMGFIKKD